MNESEEKQQRLKEIERYISLGRKLEEVLTDCEDSKKLSLVLENLREYSETYSGIHDGTVRCEEGKKLTELELEVKRDEFIKKHAVLWDGEEIPRMIFDIKNPHPKRKVDIPSKGQRIRIAHILEFKPAEKEALFREKLSEAGYSESDISRIIRKPELFYYGILTCLRDKYAPHLKLE